MHVIGYTEARNSLKAVIDRVIDDQDVRLIHGREGGNVVVLSEQAYSSMNETLHLLANPTNAKVLLTSVAEYKAGKTKRRSASIYC